MGGNVIDPGTAAWILFGGFFGMLALRVPVAVALGLACLPPLLLEPRLWPMILVQETFNAYNSFILLAVPFFLLAANLMTIGGITERLIRLSRAMVGHLPGSLAQINVVLSIFFAGICGSSTADAASQGKMFIEAQTREGYDVSFSVAITAVSAVLAAIIPPSIMMIVWGGVLTVSIGALEATVMHEWEVENLTEIEKVWSKLATHPDHQQWGRELEPYVVSGTSRWQVYRVL